MSRVIPKEQLAGYQRWQAGSFDKPAQAGGEPARAGSPPPAQEAANLATAAEQAGEMVVDIPFPTAEDLARINEEARTKATSAATTKAWPRPKPSARRVPVSRSPTWRR